MSGKKLLSSDNVSMEPTSENYFDATNASNVVANWKSVKFNAYKVISFSESTYIYIKKIIEKQTDKAWRHIVGRYCLS